MNLHNVSLFSTGEIRCHCNLAPCVSTGYMCKSRQGLCFSDNVATQGDRSPDTELSRHGCMDLVARPGSEARACREGATSSRDDGAVGGPVLERWDHLVAPGEEGSRRVVERHCCSQDMCNFHRDYHHSESSGEEMRPPYYNTNKVCGAFKRIFFFI